MKTFGRSILLAGALAAGVHGLIAAQSSNPWLEQWHKAKYGHNSPTANTAFHAELTPKVTAPANTWLDQLYITKYGRSSPMEEERLKAERENTAFREEIAPEVTAPAGAWFDQWYKAKFGRISPLEAARQEAAAR